MSSTTPLRSLVALPSEKSLEQLGSGKDVLNFAIVIMQSTYPSSVANRAFLNAISSDFAQVSGHENPARLDDVVKSNSGRGFKVEFADAGPLTLLHEVALVRLGEAFDRKALQVLKGDCMSTTTDERRALNTYGFAHAGNLYTPHISTASRAEGKFLTGHTLELSHLAFCDVDTNGLNVNIVAQTPFPVFR